MSLELFYRGCHFSVYWFIGHHVVVWALCIVILNTCVHLDPNSRLAYLTLTLTLTLRHYDTLTPFAKLSHSASPRPCHLG